MSYTSAAAFEPWTFKSLKLRNRIAMAPMTRRKAPENGIATAEIAAYYARRAQEEVGLVISEGTSIDGIHAYDTLTVPRFETPEQIAAWKTVVEAVHEAGGAFAPQLWHTGRLAADPIGPSACEMPARADGKPRKSVRAMEASDFDQVLQAYRHSADQAVAIGCDALEIHGAHGYLLDSFVSPVNNERTDKYGGSFEARMTFPLEVVRAIRSVVGPDYPIIYRFSQWKVDDYKEVKFTNPDELGKWVNALKDAGVDILHVSTRSCLDLPFEDAGDKTLSGWSRELSGLPTIAVGKISTTLSMDQAYGETRDVVTDPGPCLDLVDKGEADLLAVGRALIPNPDWVRVVRDGDWKTLKTFDRACLETLV